MIRAARAVFVVSASLGCLSVGQETTRRVKEARNASINSREAGELSRSWTTIGRSLTEREIAFPSSTSRTRGSASARSSVRQSRTIWVNSLRVCATIRRMPFSFVSRHDCHATLLRLRNYTDEYVFHREAFFACNNDVNPVCFKALFNLPFCAVNPFVCHYVKTIAE